MVLALMHSPENKAPARQVMDAKPFFCRNVGRLDVVTTEIATVLVDLGHIVLLRLWPNNSFKPTPSGAA